MVQHLSSLGGLAGLAAVIAAILSGRRQDADVRAVRAQVEPNHGSSLADAIRRIETGQDALREDLGDLSRRLGHEIGEVRRDLADARRDHDERLRALEHPPG